MIDTILVCSVALVASALTLYSGFGLGTFLLPVFALFFPVTTAVAATAVVHLANNLVKLALVGRFADRSVLRRFAVPAVIASVAGARLLSDLSRAEPLAVYEVFGAAYRVTPIGLVVGALVFLFALWESVPRMARVGIDPRYLALGGALSGFFGGLSGQQGSLRTAFLIRAGLSKESFIGTGVVIACLVDVGRIALYGKDLGVDIVRDEWRIIAAATASAITGVVVATWLLPRVSMHAVRRIVAVMLFVMAAAMMAGIV